VTPGRARRPCMRRKGACRKGALSRHEPSADTHNVPSARGSLPIPRLPRRHSRGAAPRIEKFRELEVSPLPGGFQSRGGPRSSYIAAPPLTNPPFLRSLSLLLICTLSPFPSSLSLPPLSHTLQVKATRCASVLHRTSEFWNQTTDSPFELSAQPSPLRLHSALQGEVCAP
jgi:hypothetical protein